MHESSRGGKIALTGLQWRKTSFDQLSFLIGALYPPNYKIISENNYIHFVAYLDRSKKVGK